MERTRIHGGPTMGKVYQDTDGRKVIFSLQDLTFWVVGKPDRFKILKKGKKDKSVCAVPTWQQDHIQKEDFPSRRV